MRGSVSGRGDVIQLLCTLVPCDIIIGTEIQLNWMRGLMMIGIGFAVSDDWTSEIRVLENGSMFICGPNRPCD